MRLLSRVGTFLRLLMGRTRMESEMDTELRFHLRARVEDLVRNGAAPEEAKRRAQIEFGGLERAKEECRDARGANFLDGLAQDLRYGVRMLWNMPAFTAIAVVTLALGIGANTAIFSLVNTVLLRPLPYKDADRLITVWSNNRTRGLDTDLVSPLDFADWHSQSHSFKSIAASTDTMYTLTGQGEPTLIVAYAFAPDYFHVLGVAPVLGRTFLPEEEQAGRNQVAVLSYSFWQNRLGGKRDVVGTSLTLDGAPYTVVGVMPPDFRYPPSTELWTPLTIDPVTASDRSNRYLRVMARLKAGVTTEEAQKEMNVIARELALRYPKTNKEEDATNLIGLRATISGDIRPALLVLLCAVGFVLLIACTNVANLLLARAADREKEVAVRAAVGASWSRLARQFLTESTLLGVIGGTCGILLAGFGTKALVGMFPSTIFNLNIPKIEQIPVDGRVLSFGLTVSLLVGLLFGLAPALQARMNASEPLKEFGRGVASHVRGRRFRSALIVAELAVSVLLLAAAGLALRSFVYLLRGNLGFDPDQVLTMRVLLSTNRYQTDDQRIAFSDRALIKVQALPGVKAAGTVTFLPLSGWFGNRVVALEGQGTPENERPMTVWSSVTPDYFQAMGTPLVKGRYFTEWDRRSAPGVAIVSQSLARQLQPDGDLVGKRIEVSDVKGAVEIVGIVGDVHQLGMTSQMTSEIYLPFAQLPEPVICFAIRTAGDPNGIAKAAQQAIWSVDKDQAVAFVMRMDQLAAESLAPHRFVMLILGAFGGMALMMAAVGIYGVIASSVAQRTQEIGIRMALGARRGQVLRLVLGQGVRLVALGAAIGLSSAIVLTRFLSSVLYGVRPTDPGILVAAVLSLAGVAMLATYIPARRGTRVDPMVALRYE